MHQALGTYIVLQSKLNLKFSFTTLAIMKIFLQDFYLINFALNDIREVLEMHYNFVINALCTLSYILYYEVSSFCHLDTEGY